MLGNMWGWGGQKKQCLGGGQKKSSKNKGVGLIRTLALSGLSSSSASTKLSVASPDESWDVSIAQKE